ncbi:unnamed protein product [Rotaria socialis]|uniref:Uncharacterized protein n=1 Tax=Rotaria socialis TaxID=392032 RepID=A0A820M7P6_9BILA|nr:unnamed protein product [Rotaria socialis]CAF4369271.1 unnamed protein product [Rotaria socialis]
MNSGQNQTLFLCTVSECNRESCALCRCCEENYCLQHLIAHTGSRKRALNCLNDEINKLDQQIKILNIQPAIENCRQKFEQWRVECHNRIDKYFERKIFQFHRFIDEKIDDQRTEIHRLQSEVDELINRHELNDQDFNSLRSIINDVGIEIDYVKKIYDQVNIDPLPIDDNLISINKPNNFKLNPSSLSIIDAAINHPQGSYGALAGNEKCLLVHLTPNLILMDKRMNTIQQIEWPYGVISSICWSSTKKRFVVIGKSSIYLVDGRNMSIESLKMMEKRKWFSCACSDTSLFLSIDEINPSIVEFHLLPSIRMVNQWKSPYLCAKDECIDHISYNNSTLVLMISNNVDRSVRMELRLSKTLELIWSLKFDIIRQQRKAFRCCSINSNEWLVADYQNRRLLHVEKDGKVKTIIPYDLIPCHVVLFGSNLLAVSRKNGINFHRL